MSEGSEERYNKILEKLGLTPKQAAELHAAFIERSKLMSEKKA